MLRKLLVMMLFGLMGCCGGTTNDAKAPVGKKPQPPPTDPCATPSQLASALSGASQGAVLSLYEVNPLGCPEIGMTETWAGGKLIFSDSPEHPSSSGKVYEDTTLSATVGTDYNRIFLYHTNGLGGSARMKWTVLIKNNGSSAGTLTVQKSGMAGPTTAYLYAGKMAFYRWATSTVGNGVEIPAGETVRLDAAFDSITTAPTYLMHGIWDYSMSQPHTVTVCALGETEDPLAVCPGLAVLPRDTHQRGTCPHADKVYDAASAFDTKDNIQQFPLAGDTPNDAAAQCVDKTDGAPQKLTGNYGVLYRIHLSITATDGRMYGFLMNPRGGTWGGALWTLPGLTPGGKFLVPPGTAAVTQNTEGAVEGRYDPGSHSAPWLQWMPTGGSSLPLRFVVVPY